MEPKNEREYAEATDWERRRTAITLALSRSPYLQTYEDAKRVAEGLMVVFYGRRP